MGKQLARDKEMGSSTYLRLGLESCNKAVSEPPKIFSVLCFVLEKSIRKNEKLLKSSKCKNMATIFHSSIAPGVSIKQYIDRIFKYSNCSPSCLVVAYIYMDKFLQQVGDRLTSLNVHRLLITSIVLAAKYVEDECYSNAYYAKVGGVSKEEMNRMEMKFLVSIDFRLHVTLETFNRYCSQLEIEQSAAGK
ncbi:hypothetical protein ACET3Z_030958 [Daucus carota]